MMKRHARALASSLMIVAFGTMTIGSAAAAETKSVTGTTRVTKSVKTAPPKGGTVTGTTGTTVVELNSSDCKLLLGGQVVTVTDGRCGASGAYCKSPTGSACLTEK